jgi:hypothetical protein
VYALKTKSFRNHFEPFPAVLHLPQNHPGGFGGGWEGAGCITRRVLHFSQTQVKYLDKYPKAHKIISIFIEMI